MTGRFITIALASAFGILLLLPAPCSADPQMVLKQQIHDFKNVLEGEILSHPFEVLNHGDATLRIEQVKPECTCSAADFDVVILPGGEGRITVRIATKGFEGKQRWAVKVYSNDPKWPEAVLDLRANVKPVIAITGAPVFLGGKKKNPRTAEVEITTGLDRDLILTPERFTLSGKATYSLAEIEKGKRYRVTFQNVTRKRENYKGSLKLKTNFAERPDVTIWIIGRFEK